MGDKFYKGDPLSTFQDVTGKPSQGTIKFVKVANNYSHSIDDIINAFHKNSAKKKE
ncbi:MAG: hypothetical protein LIR46_14110 [Bacteroidota bacterium]|nr:hypothetical protein [Bacteroidota bacterium]